MFSEDDASGTIPLGSVITQARLILELQDDVDTPFANPDFYVHEVLVPWDESSTWNSLGNGLSVPEDLGDRVATFLGDNDPSSDFGRSMDVTALVQRWSDGQANWGGDFARDRDRQRRRYFNLDQRSVQRHDQTTS